MHVSNSKLFVNVYYRNKKVLSVGSLSFFHGMQLVLAVYVNCAFVSGSGVSEGFWKENTKGIKAAMPKAIWFTIWNIHASDPTPREVTTTIVSKAGKNDVCEMQLHKQTCPPSWELGGYATLQILNEWHTLCEEDTCTDKLEKNFVHFFKTFYADIIFKLSLCLQ